LKLCPGVCSGNKCSTTPVKPAEVKKAPLKENDVSGGEGD
jgi:hypothetical protein